MKIIDKVEKIKSEVAQKLQKNQNKIKIKKEKIENIMRKINTQ